MGQLGIKRVVGLVVLILGISLLLLSFVNFTRTDTVIDTAFSLESGEKYGPRYYVPPIDCVLTGKVSVEGEGIYVTVDGLWHERQSTFVDSDFNFTIDPAYGWDHFYRFTFDNTNGDFQSHVEFVLDETLTESPVELFWRSMGLPRSLWLYGIGIGIFLLLPTGFILILWSLIQERRKRTVLIEHEYQAR